MGKFGNSTVSELCSKMVRAARTRSCDEGLKEQREEDGLIVIGIQPLTAEAEEWTGIESGGKIALHCYSLVKGKDYGRRFRPRLERIEDDMDLSAKNNETCFYSIDWPVDNDIGSTCTYEIRDYETKALLMRVGIFVSGDNDFARECCYASRKEIKKWTMDASGIDANTGMYCRYIFTPRIHHNRSTPKTTAKAIAS